MLHVRQPANGLDTIRDLRGGANRGQGRKAILSRGRLATETCSHFQWEPRSARGRQILVGVVFLRRCRAAAKAVADRALEKADKDPKVQAAEKAKMVLLNEARPFPAPLDDNGWPDHARLSLSDQEANSAHFRALPPGQWPLNTYHGEEARIAARIAMGRALRKPISDNPKRLFYLPRFRPKYGRKRIAEELAREITEKLSFHVSPRHVLTCGTWVFKRQPKRIYDPKSNTFAWKRAAAAF